MFSTNAKLDSFTTLGPLYVPVVNVALANITVPVALLLSSQRLNVVLPVGVGLVCESYPL